MIRKKPKPRLTISAPIVVAIAFHQVIYPQRSHLLDGPKREQCIGFDSFLKRPNPDFYREGTHIFKLNILVETLTQNPALKCQIWVKWMDDFYHSFDWFSMRYTLSIWKAKLDSLHDFSKSYGYVTCRNTIHTFVMKWHINVYWMAAGDTLMFCIDTYTNLLWADMWSELMDTLASFKV